MDISVGFGHDLSLIFLFPSVSYITKGIASVRVKSDGLWTTLFLGDKQSDMAIWGVCPILLADSLKLHNN